jgi:class 3 adenylate cyclase
VSLQVPDIIEEVDATVVSVRFRGGVVYNPFSYKDAIPSWHRELFDVCQKAAVNRSGEIVGQSAERLDCLFRDSDLAIRGAIEIRDFLIARIAEREVLRRMTFSIGLHRGDVMLLQRPYPSILRLVVGYDLSVAQHVADLGSKHDTTILISDAVFGADHEYQLEQAEEIPVKGTSQPLRLHRLVADPA